MKMLEILDSLLTCVAIIVSAFCTGYFTGALIVSKRHLRFLEGLQESLRKKEDAKFQEDNRQQSEEYWWNNGQKPNYEGE